MFVCDALCIILNKKTGWDTFKKLAADKSFIQMLQCYDRDKVSVKTLRKLKPYIESSRIKPDSLIKKSEIVAKLGEWLIAVFNYGVGNLKEGQTLNSSVINTPKRAKVEQESV